MQAIETDAEYLAHFAGDVDAATDYATLLIGRERRRGGAPAANWVAGSRCSPLAQTRMTHCRHAGAMGVPSHPLPPAPGPARRRRLADVSELFKREIGVSLAIGGLMAACCRSCWLRSAGRHWLGSHCWERQRAGRRAAACACQPRQHLHPPGPPHLSRVSAPLDRAQPLSGGHPQPAQPFQCAAGRVADEPAGEILRTDGPAGRAPECGTLDGERCSGLLGQNAPRARPPRSLSAPSPPLLPARAALGRVNAIRLGHRCRP